MTFEEAIQKTSTKDFHLDCVEMTLTQCGALKPTVFVGKGTIGLDLDGEIVLKTFVVSQEDLDLHAQLNDFGQVSGKLVEEQQYYNLSAVDSTGKTWTSERQRMNFNWPLVVSEFPIITGKLRSLRSEEAIRFKEHSLKLFLFHELAFPSNFGKAIARPDIETTFDAAGCTFTIAQAANSANITVTSDKPISAVFYVRVIEALKFVTCRPVLLGGMLHSDDSKRAIDLASGQKVSLGTGFLPPLNRSSWQLPRDGVEMFRRYLEYVDDDDRGEDWHHATYYVHNANEASAGSVDTWAVGLSVAIEGLASLLPVVSDPAGKAKLDALRDYVIAKVAEEPRFKDQTERLQGLLGMMGSVRVQDRLQPMIATGHVEVSHRAAWQKLRNRHVHPSAVDLKHSSSRDFQGLFDLIGKATVLMYHIVFYLIGYRGVYSDYGSEGYPERTYPTPADVENSGRPTTASN